MVEEYLFATDKLHRATELHGNQLVHRDDRWLAGTELALLALCRLTPERWLEESMREARDDDRLHHLFVTSGLFDSPATASSSTVVTSGPFLTRPKNLRFSDEAGKNPKLVGLLSDPALLALALDLRPSSPSLIDGANIGDILLVGYAHYDQNLVRFIRDVLLDEESGLAIHIAPSGAKTMNDFLVDLFTNPESIAKHAGLYPLSEPRELNREVGQRFKKRQWPFSPPAAPQV
jgi:hypothetical protein